ncbi:MAG TPA: hypothetical protein VGK67_12970 [Myxococcales bacterium]|jgi:hypothetical protein
MAKREANKAAKRAAGRAADRPLTKADFDEVMGQVFGRFSVIDQRFAEERDWIEQRFKETDEKFKETDEKIVFEIKRQTLLLEQIRAENRTAGESVTNEEQRRERAIQELRDEIVPRLDSVESAVREHSAQLQTKADRSLEKRVEDLETASKR